VFIMKKLAMILLTLTLVGSMIGFAGCSSSTGTATTAAGAGQTTAATKAGTTAAATTAAGATTTAAGSTQKVFTLDELKTFDGLNGNPAYVAVNGNVYDVTNVKGWSNGAHQTHLAGQDLSSVIESAPHGTSILDGLTIVGTLG
jgi:predicted heme/steroid binding protein